MTKKPVKASKKVVAKKIVKKAGKKSPVKPVKLDKSLINPLRQAAKASAARRTVK